MISRNSQRFYPIGVLTLMLLCGLRGEARAELRILLPEDPAGEEVRAVAGEFLKQLAAGNSDAAKALFSGTKEQEELLAAHLRFTGACVKIEKSFATGSVENPFRTRTKASRMSYH